MGPYGANSMRHNQNFANEWGVFSNVTQEFKRRRRWVKKIYDSLFYGTFMVMVFTTWMIFCLHKYEQITPSVMIHHVLNAAPQQPQTRCATENIWSIDEAFRAKLRQPPPSPIHNRLLLCGFPASHCTAESRPVCATHTGAPSSWFTQSQYLGDNMKNYLTLSRFYFVCACVCLWGGESFSWIRSITLLT